MGISGLLPLLRSIHKTSTLRKFAGQTIGIDAYGWLHRGTAACASELALDKPTNKHVEFALNRVRMLLDFGVTPYLVFDGDDLPSKAGTNNDRRKRRDESKTLGLQLYKAGKVSQAYQEFQKAVDVTPYMARQLIEELQKLNVQYIVAPYEADAQLAYLEKVGVINGILSEDSDLLVFGTKRLLTKLNQHGECIEIDRTDLALCKDINLTGWNDAMFRRMAILSGCDYLTNIEKMGLKTAYRYVRKYKEPEKLLRMIQFEGKFCVPSGYLERFQQAELTFLHHRVFCPIKRQMVFLNDLESGMKEDDMMYLGPYVDDETAIGVACGDLDPKTKEPIVLSLRSASRPPLRENRRQTFDSATTLKPKSSIDSFFKAHRQPLAELDPNSLTPSPSQQRLLDRNRNASWVPRMVSSAPQLRGSQTTGSHASVPDDTLPNNTNRSTFLARASLLSSYQPPKRQRLCSESEDLSPSKEFKQSPFFVTQIAEPSPLAQKKGNSKRHKMADFDVWSDDSVDEILLGLPDVQQLASPDKEDSTTCSEQMMPTQDEKPNKEIDSVPQSSPLRSPRSSSLPNSEPPSSAPETPRPPKTSPPLSTIISRRDDPEAFEDLLDYHVRKQNEKLLQTFVYQPSSNRNAALKSLSRQSKQMSSQAVTFVAQSPEKQVAALRSLPKPSEALKTPKDRSQTFSRLPASQKADALSSLVQCSETTRATEATMPALAIANDGDCTRPTASKGFFVEKTKIKGRDYSILPQKEPCLDGVFPDVQNNHSRESDRPAMPLLTGSEDAVIPNSEDEVSESDQRESKLDMDLTAFAFVAA